MSFFFFSNSPGDTLRGIDICRQIDQVSNESQYSIGLNANSCIILSEVIMTTTPNVLAEVIFFLRRRINLKRQPKTIFLTLAVIDHLSKSCGEQFLLALDEKFCNKMFKVAIHYNKLSGPENIAVATLILELIQFWGVSQSLNEDRYPQLIRLYRNSLAQNLPFKRPVIMSPDNMQHAFRQSSYHFNTQESFPNNNRLDINTGFPLPKFLLVCGPLIFILILNNSNAIS